ncbi:MAG: M15 family metallopeptidase [Spirochaetales bacterium]|nr:M15 family metallopeptidase [Spirochaetales bacterium]
MRQNREFKVRNEVKRHRTAPYVVTAAALIVTVVVFVAVRAALGGGPAAVTANNEDADLPRGGGPDIPAAASPAAPTGRANPYSGEAWFADPDGLLVVVDRKRALAPNYAPTDLVPLTSHGVPARPDTLTARRVIIDDLKEMFAAGKKAGFDYFVFSAYRSYKTQTWLFEYWVKKLGRAEAERSSARAGHSEHQLGTTLDISVEGLTGDVFEVFGASPAGAWLSDNGWRFGFVMSYPEDAEETTGYEHEPWHFRYVGREAAKIVHNRGAIPSVFIRELEELRRGARTAAP